jgi:hypothetical protein
MNHIRITYVLLLQIHCKCDARREDRTERRYTDMRYIGISRYREIGSPSDRETERLGDREQKSAGGWKANNRVSIANAPK